MEKGIKIMATIGLFALIGLSGCTTNSPDLDSNNPGSSVEEDEKDRMPEETYMQEKSFYWGGESAPWNVCVPPRPDYLFCMVKTDLELKPVGPFPSMVIESFSFQLDWEKDSLPSLQGREVTVSCDAEKASNCTEFPKTFMSDESPLEGKMNDLELPPNTTLEFMINIPDPLPEPVQFEFDINQEWRLEATATLKSVA